MNPEVPTKEQLNAQLMTYGCRVDLAGLTWADSTLRVSGIPVEPNAWKARLNDQDFVLVYRGALGRWKAEGRTRFDFDHPYYDPAGAIIMVVGILRDAMKKELAMIGPSSAGECRTEDAVIELLRSRGTVGRRKYGVSMDRSDLPFSQWMRHFQEELGDALQYGERLKQAGQLLEEAAAIMGSLAGERDWDVAKQWLGKYDEQFGDTPKNE